MPEPKPEIFSEEERGEMLLDISSRRHPGA